MKRLALALVFLFGCDSVVSTTQVGQTRTEQRLGTCHKMGFCHTCGIDFQGKFSCGFRMTSQCPGERNETVKIQTVKEKFESGKVRERDVITVVEAGSCR